MPCNAGLLSSSYRSVLFQSLQMSLRNLPQFLFQLASTSNVLFGSAVLSPTTRPDTASHTNRQPFHDSCCVAAHMHRSSTSLPPPSPTTPTLQPITPPNSTHALTCPTTCLLNSRQFPMHTSILATPLVDRESWRGLDLARCEIRCASCASCMYVIPKPVPKIKIEGHPMSSDLVCVCLSALLHAAATLLHGHVWLKTLVHLKHSVAMDG